MENPSCAMQESPVEHEQPATANLGIADEGDADGQLALHPPRERLGAGVPLVLQVEDADSPVHLLGDVLTGEALQLRKQSTSKAKPKRRCMARRTCAGESRPAGGTHLGKEEQVLLHGEVVEKHVMLRAQAQAAAYQRHVLADVIAIDIGAPPGGGKEAYGEDRVS